MIPAALFLNSSLLLLPLFAIFLRGVGATREGLPSGEHPFPFMHNMPSSVLSGAPIPAVSVSEIDAKEFRHYDRWSLAK